jgi:hypothetical protein
MEVSRSDAGFHSALAHGRNRSPCPFAEFEDSSAYRAHMFDQALPPELKAFAEREFLGERLVWAARPDVTIFFWMSFGVWLFAIPWTAFSLFWISIPAAALYEAYAGVNIGAPKGAPLAMMWAFAIFGVPFVAVGVGMLLTPFRTLWRGRRTLYVLTGKRLAILQGRSSVKITSILPRDITGLSRKEGPDGRGTLTVLLGVEIDSDGDRIPKQAALGVIPEVRRVEEMVRELKARET